MRAGAQCLDLVPTTLQVCQKLYYEGLPVPYGQSTFNAQVVSPWQYERSHIWRRCLEPVAGMTGDMPSLPEGRQQHSRHCSLDSSPSSTMASNGVTHSPAPSLCAPIHLSRVVFQTAGCLLSTAVGLTARSRCRTPMGYWSIAGTACCSTAKTQSDRRHLQAPDCSVLCELRPPVTRCVR